LRDTLPLSLDFQGDLRRLAEFGATGRLRSFAGGLDQLKAKAA